MTDKNTFTGRDIREYKCDACGYEDWEDRGTALWQILSDDRKEFEAEKAAPEDATSTRLNRFLAWLGISPKDK
jgi:hypothetical protein